MRHRLLCGQPRSTPLAGRPALIVRCEFDSVSAWSSPDDQRWSGRSGNPTSGLDAYDVAVTGGGRRLVAACRAAGGRSVVVPEKAELLGDTSVSIAVVDHAYPGGMRPSGPRSRGPTPPGPHRA